MQKRKFQFLSKGVLKRIIVLGIGDIPKRMAKIAIKRNINVEIYGGKRQLKNLDQNGILAIKKIQESKIKYKILHTLKSYKNGPYYNNPKNTVIFSFGSPFIISKELITRYQGRIINCHASPLPEWRGGGGFSWRILADDRRGNSCFHLVTKGIDDGKILLQKSYIFPKRVKFPKDYIGYANSQSAKLLPKLIDKIINGEFFKPIQQNENKSTYFPRLDSKSQGYIDWSWEGKFIKRFIMAFSHPYDGAKSFVNNKIVRIYDADFIRTKRMEHSFMRGLIIRKNNREIFISCNNGILKVKESNLKTQSELKLGDRLFTPNSKLEAALKIRIRYNPSGIVDEKKNK